MLRIAKKSTLKSNKKDLKKRIEEEVDRAYRKEKVILFYFTQIKLHTFNTRL